VNISIAILFKEKGYLQLVQLISCPNQYNIPKHHPVTFFLVVGTYVTLLLLCAGELLLKLNDFIVAVKNESLNKKKGFSFFLSSHSNDNPGTVSDFSLQNQFSC
jgi:hypothetical protein